MTQPTEHRSIKSTWSLMASGGEETRRVVYSPSSMENKKTTDMIIRCGTDEHHVHKEIVCPRSEFIAAAINGQFKEGKTGVLVLNEDDPATVSRMLEFLYTNTYHDNTISIGPDTSSENPSPTADNPEDKMLVHVNIYSLAEMFNIPDLKTLAQQRFSRLVYGYWLYDSITPITSAVFSSTPATDTGLREIMIQICIQHQKELLADPEFIEILTQHGDLSLAMLRGFALEKEREMEQIHRQHQRTIKELEEVQASMHNEREKTKNERANLKEELKDLERKLKAKTSAAYSRAERTDGDTKEARRLWVRVKDVRLMREEYIEQLGLIAGGRDRDEGGGSGN